MGTGKNVKPVEDKPVEDGTGAPPQNRRRPWDPGQLSALAAVIGAVTSLTYLLALFVLWVPLTVNVSMVVGLVSLLSRERPS